MDLALSQILHLGVGTLLSKLDIKDQYHIVPVHPEDWQLLGLYWKGDYCDWLTATFNNLLPSKSWRMPSPENHPATKNPLEITDPEDDYITLVNTVQRHTRCNAVYCLQKRSGQSQASKNVDLTIHVPVKILLTYTLKPSQMGE